MAAEPDLEAVRGKLAMAGYHDGRVQSFVMQTTILLSAWEGTIADDEEPPLPPGDPGWFRQAAEILSRAVEETDQLRRQLLAAQLSIYELLPSDEPDLALSINLDIVVSRHRATPRGTR
jgi:hypothetical protein